LLLKWPLGVHLPLESVREGFCSALTASVELGGKRRDFTPTSRTVSHELRNECVKRGVTR
jgi:hypothetical protein